MSANTPIEWTGATWNPTLGCSKKSPGCKNCYAIRVAHRLQRNPNPKIAKAFEGLTIIQNGAPNWTGRVNFVPDRLSIPLRTKKPTTYFVNSLSDLFHENVSDEQIYLAFAVMHQCPQHTFQVLTKEAERMREWCANAPARFGHLPPIGKAWPLPNVWLGTSVENQEYADKRIPLLLQTPAAVRFISAEPLLGPVDLGIWTEEGLECSACKWKGTEAAAKEDGDEEDPGLLCPKCNERCCHTPLDELLGAEIGINWVIAGGESGPDARPCDVAWIRSLIQQCEAAGVPCFVKQLGAKPIDNDSCARCIPASRDSICQVRKQYHV